MLGFLISPAARMALAGVAIVAALGFVGVYLHNVKQAGVAQERAAETSRAVAAQERAAEQARAADDAVAQVADPLAELRKRGWIVDVPKN